MCPRSPQTTKARGGFQNQNKIKSCELSVWTLDVVEDDVGRRWTCFWTGSASLSFTNWMLWYRWRMTRSHWPPELSPESMFRPFTPFRTSSRTQEPSDALKSSPKAQSKISRGHLHENDFKYSTYWKSFSKTQTSERLPANKLSVL